MIPLAILFVLGLGWAVIGPILLVRKGEPHVKPAPEFEPVEIEENQARYERVAPVLQLIKLASLSVYVWLTVEASRNGLDVSLNQVLDALTAVISVSIASFAVGLFLRARRDRALAARFPQMQIAIPPISRQLIPIAVPQLFIGLVVLALRTRNVELIWTGIIVFFIAMILLRRISVRLLNKGAGALSTTELTEDNPIRLILRSFGREASDIKVIPSSTANAYVLVDRSVAITSMLRDLLTDAETAALIASRLAIVERNDLKTVARASRLGGLIYYFVILAVAALLSRSVQMFIILFFAGLSLLPFGLALIKYLGRNVYFVADRAGERFGLRDAMRSGLLKMYRLGGAPLRWYGLDRWLSGSPSLEERLNALSRSDGDPTTHESYRLYS